MARRKKRKRRPPKFLNTKVMAWLFLLFLFLSVTAIAGYEIYTAPFFELSEESFRSNFKINRELVKAKKGSSIFGIDLKQIHSAIKKHHPEYETIELVKRFPNVIKIRIKKRNPLAEVAADGFYLVDKNGIVTSGPEDSSSQRFPLIEGVVNRPRLSKGDNIYSRELETAFDLIDAVKKYELIKVINSLGRGYRFRLDSLNIRSPEAIYFYLVDQNRIKIIVSKENLEEKINILTKLIAQKLNNKISLVRYIDLRFEKVAVGFRR